MRAAFLLLARKQTRIAASGALAFFLAFALVLSAAIIRGVDLPCNCFGAFGPDLPMRAQAVLDLVLSALAFALVRTTLPADNRVWGHPGVQSGSGGRGNSSGDSLIVLWPNTETAPG